MQFSILQKQVVSGDTFQKILHHGKAWLTTSVNGSNMVSGREPMMLLLRFIEKRRGKKDPSYGIVDSQSTKTVLTLDGCGYDGGKKVKGRKRHIVVDTLGNLLAIVVHAANIHDTKSAHLVLSKAHKKYASIKAFSGDAGYRKSAVEFVERQLGLRMDISEKIKDEFAVLPIRWIVERTFAWIGNYRRLAKDFERLSKTVEAFVTIAMIRVTLRKCV
jgi:putative transposase